MKLYESRLKVKSSIDRMQIDLECCGSTNYRDWWKVGWWSVRWLDTSSPEVSIHFLYMISRKKLL